MHLLFIILYFLSIVQKDEKLWNKAKLSSDQKCFYVSSLSNYITPGKKQVVSKINNKSVNIINYIFINIFTILQTILILYL